MSKQSLLRQPSLVEPTPKYVTLARRLLRHMADKRLRAGDRLGTEFELVRKYGVSRVTVRQALLTLEQDGYVAREKARGTFVKKAVKRPAELGLTRGCIVLACPSDQASHIEEDAAFATVLRAIERSVTERGFTLQVLSFGANEAADRTRLTELANREDLEGVCAVGRCLEPYYSLFPDLPLVTSCSWGPTPSPLVNPDTREACRTCIDYLLAHGHRDIAMLCTSRIGQESFSLFAGAFTEAFESAGLPCPRHLMHQAYSGEPLKNLAAQLLSGPLRPTAVFAENWKICEAVLSAANEQGVQIPDDLSLIAFGRNVLRISYPHAITAYVPDHEAIGENAVETLAALIDGETVSEKTLAIPGRLVERDSVRVLEGPAGKENHR